MAAKTAYEALSDSDKELVTNASKTMTTSTGGAFITTIVVS